MPTRKKPRKPKAEQREVSVTLTEKDRIEFGRALLGIRDGPRRQVVLAEFARLLDGCASDLANADDMKLNSDFIAAARPLVSAASRFKAKLRAGDIDVLSLMEHFEFVELGTLFQQLDGIERFMGWLKTDPSKRGGERRSYVKRAKVVWSHVFENWFGRHHKRSDPDAVPMARRKFVKKAVKAVERTLREAGLSVPNKGKK